MATLNSKWVLWHRIGWGTFVNGCGGSQTNQDRFIHNLIDLKEEEKPGLKKKTVDKELAIVISSLFFT